MYLYALNVSTHNTMLRALASIVHSTHYQCSENTQVFGFDARQVWLKWAGSSSPRNRGLAAAAAAWMNRGSVCFGCMRLRSPFSKHDDKIALWGKCVRNSKCAVGKFPLSREYCWHLVYFENLMLKSFTHGSIGKQADVYNIAASISASAYNSNHSCFCLFQFLLYSSCQAVRLFYFLYALHV